MRGARAALLAVGMAAALGALSAMAGCASRPPPVVARAAAEPHWQDMFDTIPELLVVLRPQALKRDTIVGPLLRSAIDAARRQSRVVAATRALDTIEDAEEVVVGMRPDAPDHAGELVLVERGVRADVDPEKLVDGDGHTLWAPGPSGAVRELVRAGQPGGEPADPGPGATPDDASLFELPGRTWVIATGDARTRAREAFAHPLGRPPPKLDPDALAIVRIDGPSIVARIEPLQDRGGLAAVGHELRSVTLVLPPGGPGAVEARLAYGGDDAAALSAVALREAIGAVARAKPARLAWLATAEVDRTADGEVLLRAPLPPQLIEGLLQAGKGSLPEPTLSPVP